MNDMPQGCADALMIMTEWPVFRTPEFDKVEVFYLNNKVILMEETYKSSTDGRAWFIYHSTKENNVKRASNPRQSRLYWSHSVVELTMPDMSQLYYRQSL